MLKSESKLLSISLLSSIEFINLIQLQLFLAKSKTKVYIQKLMNKEIKIPVIKKS